MGLCFEDFLGYWTIGLMDYYWTYNYTRFTLLDYQLLKLFDNFFGLLWIFWTVGLLYYWTIMGLTTTLDLQG